MYIKIFNYIFLLSAMSFRSHFKDSNFPSFCLETKSWQTHQFLPYSNNLADFNNVNKEFLPKKSSPKKSSQNNPVEFRCMNLFKLIFNMISFSTCKLRKKKLFWTNTYVRSFFSFSTPQTMKNSWKELWNKLVKISDEFFIYLGSEP